MAKKHKQDPIGHSKAKVVEATVDNPYFQPEHPEGRGNPKQIIAKINMNESIAAHWLHKGKIEQSEYVAASRFRYLWEGIGGRGAGSFDYTREKVDLSGHADPIPVGQAEKASELREIHSILGPEAYNIVCKLCGECQTMGQLGVSRRKWDDMVSVCKAMLVHMAVHWGYRSAGIRKSA